jgi:hypothetical protein
MPVCPDIGLINLVQLLTNPKEHVNRKPQLTQRPPEARTQRDGAASSDQGQKNRRDGMTGEILLRLEISALHCSWSNFFAGCEDF